MKVSKLIKGLVFGIVLLSGFFVTKNAFAATCVTYPDPPNGPDTTPPAENCTTTADNGSIGVAVYSCSTNYTGVLPPGTNACYWHNFWCDQPCGAPGVPGGGGGFTCPVGTWEDVQIECRNPPLTGGFKPSDKCDPACVAPKVCGRRVVCTCAPGTTYTCGTPATTMCPTFGTCDFPNKSLAPICDITGSVNNGTYKEWHTCQTNCYCAPNATPMACHYEGCSNCASYPGYFYSYNPACSTSCSLGCDNIWPSWLGQDAPGYINTNGDDYVRTPACVAACAAALPTCSMSLAPNTINMPLGAPDTTVTATVNCSAPIDLVTFSSGQPGVATVTTPGTVITPNTTYTATVSDVSIGASLITGTVYSGGAPRASSTSNVNVTMPTGWFQVKDADVYSGGNLTTGVQTPQVFGLPGVAGFAGVPSCLGPIVLTLVVVYFVKKYILNK